MAPGTGSCAPGGILETPTWRLFADLGAAGRPSPSSRANLQRSINQLHFFSRIMAVSPGDEPKSGSNALYDHAGGLQDFALSLHRAGRPDCRVPNSESPAPGTGRSDWIFPEHFADAHRPFR